MAQIYLCVYTLNIIYTCIHTYKWRNSRETTSHIEKHSLSLLKKVTPNLQREKQAEGCYVI